MTRLRPFFPTARPSFPSLLILLLFLATSFASGQQWAIPSALEYGRAPAPAPVLPAVASAAPSPKPAASADGPDASRKWEVEVHGAGFLSYNPTSGASFLPGLVGGFTSPSGGSSLIVPSWYFGAGNNLYNTVVGNHFPLLNQRIASLDSVLTHAVTRRSHGPGLGARISRQITPRFSVEADVDYNFGSLALNGAGDQINAASASWQAAFSQLFGPTSCGLCSGVSVTSVATVHDHQGQELLATGALNINLWTEGKIIPYVTVGGGAIVSLGEAPTATLVGNYRFSFAGAPHNETDAVRLHYGVPGHTATGFFGAGMKYYITPHYGFRAEIRDFVSAYHVDNLLDAAPSVATLTPADAIGTTGSPSLSFSNNPSTGFPSSLSAPALANFRTLAGSGVLHQLEMTVGLFWRF